MDYKKKHKIYFTNKNYSLILILKSVYELGWIEKYINENNFIIEITNSSKDNIYLKVGNEEINLESKNKDNIETLLEKIEEISKNITEEEIKSKIELLEKFNEMEKDKPSSKISEKISNFPSVFKPTNNYFISPILIDLNIIIFIIMIISGVSFLSPSSRDLLIWGANFKPLVLEYNQWWRLITSCFLHIGILHLLFNMYALFYVGVLLEPYIGRIKFLATYIISGICASASSLWWNDLTVSAGASGAIFGMYGLFLSLLTTDIVDKNSKKELLITIVFFSLYNIFYGLSGNNGVDNAAHIGGLISGIIIGYILIPFYKRN